MTDRTIQLAPRSLIADLSEDWQVHFNDAAQLSAQNEEMKHLTSWVDDDKTRFYSGDAIYTKTISLTSDQLVAGTRFELDFGEGKPVEPNTKVMAGMRALLDGPVREAALITVNGKRMGTVWHPPYTLEVTGLHAGENQLEIRVANTAINELAGRAAPDYRLLWQRYGKRFEPWDADNLRPLPSGILGRSVCSLPNRERHMPCLIEKTSRQASDRFPRPACRW